MVKSSKQTKRTRVIGVICLSVLLLLGVGIYLYTKNVTSGASRLVTIISMGDVFPFPLVGGVRVIRSPTADGQDIVSVLTTTQMSTEPLVPFLSNASYLIHVSWNVEVYTITLTTPILEGGEILYVRVSSVYGTITDVSFTAPVGPYSL